MLAGPMDYTPGGFDNVTRADFTPRNRAPMVMGTRAHQTALFVVFESELQMVSDRPTLTTGRRKPISESCAGDLGRDARDQRSSREVDHHCAAERPGMVRGHHHQLGCART